MVMSMELFRSSDEKCLMVASGYEDGYVKLWRIHGNETELLWSERRHSESSTFCVQTWGSSDNHVVMSICLSPDNTFVVSVAADDLLVRYDLLPVKVTATTAKSMGHASVSIRSDGQRIAVGGWDGTYVFDIRKRTSAIDTTSCSQCPSF